MSWCSSNDRVVFFATGLGELSAREGEMAEQRSVCEEEKRADELLFFFTDYSSIEPETNLFFPFIFSLFLSPPFSTHLVLFYILVACV